MFGWKSYKNSSIQCKVWSKIMFQLLQKAKEEQWSLNEFIMTLISKFGESHSFQFLVSQEFFESEEAIKEWLERDWDPDEVKFHFNSDPESYRPS